MASRFLRPSRVIAVVLAVAAVAWIGSRMADSRGGGGPSGHRRRGAGAGPARRRGRGRAADAPAADDPFVRDGGGPSRPGGRARRRRHHRPQGQPRRTGQRRRPDRDHFRRGPPGGVRQAQALLDQRLAEYDANKRLIDQRQRSAQYHCRRSRRRWPLRRAGARRRRRPRPSGPTSSPRSTASSTRFPIQVGQAVQIGTEIAAIVDPDPMLAVGAVSEARREQSRLGQAAAVRFIDGTKVPAPSTSSASAPTRPPAPIPSRRRWPTRTARDRRRRDLRDGGYAAADRGSGGAAVGARLFRRRPPRRARRRPPTTRRHFIPVDVVDDGRDVDVGDRPDRTPTIIVVGQDFVKDGDPVEAPFRRLRPTLSGRDRRREAHRRHRRQPRPADARDPDLPAARRRVGLHRHPEGIDAGRPDSVHLRLAVASAASRRRMPSGCCCGRWRRRSSRSATSRR